MPFIIGWLFGRALGGWGVIGLCSWLFGAGLVGQIVAVNTSETIGKWAAAAFTISLFAWAMWKPAESEAKRGFLRALRVLIAICMIVAGIAAFLIFWSHGFRFSEPQLDTLIATGATVLCWLALVGLRKRLDFDEFRVAAG